MAALVLKVLAVWYFVLWYHAGKLQIHSVCETWPEAAQLSAEVKGWYADEPETWAYLAWDQAHPESHSDSSWPGRLLLKDAIR